MSYLPDLSTHGPRGDVSSASVRSPLQAAPSPVVASAWSADTIWYLVFIFGCTATALMMWGAYSALPRSGNSEKSLRAEHAIPKLIGEVPARDQRGSESVQVAFQPPPPPPPLPSDAASVVRFDAPPAPVPIKVDPPPVVSLPLRDVPLAAVPQDVVEPASALPEPTIFLGRNNLGDTPMLRTWKTLALYSLVAAAPVVVTAPAAVAQDNTKFEKQVEDLKKQFDSLKSLFDTAIRTIEGAAKSVDALKGDIGKVQEDVGALKATKLSFDIELTKTNAKIDNLEKQLTQLQSDINSLRRELSRPGGAVTAADRAGLEELKKHLVGIEQAIIKLQPHEPGTANRIALSSPTPTARVLLVNMYHEDILFVINDKAYRVAPRSLKTLESVPAGPITYEVISPTWGLREQKTRSVSANETFSLTVQ